MKNTLTNIVGGLDDDLLAGHGFSQQKGIFFKANKQGRRSPSELVRTQITPTLTRETAIADQIARGFHHVLHKIGDHGFSGLQIDRPLEVVMHPLGHVLEHASAQHQISAEKKISGVRMDLRGFFRQDLSHFSHARKSTP